MGIVKDPKHFKLNVNCEGTMVIVTKELLREFVDVFAWNYKEFEVFHFTLWSTKLNLTSSFLLHTKHTTI